MMKLKRAFTLMEVNLAIFVMAVGVLGMVSLYSLGYREIGQGEEDVASAGFADAYLAPLVAGLSSTNMTWQMWCDAVPDVNSDACNGLYPGKGWLAYVRKIDDDNDGNYETFVVESGCNGTADGVYNKIRSNVPSEWRANAPAIPNYSYALVATRKGGVISLAFRASRRRPQLMSQPVYYTEVHFQGQTSNNPNP